MTSRAPRIALALMAAVALASVPIASEAAPRPHLDGAYGAKYPAAQKKFVSTIEKAAVDLDKTSNSLKFAKVLATRDKNLCAVLSGNKATKWVGKIIDIGANGDGYAYVSIEISPTVVVQTWNNAFSDYSDHTLIKPTEKAFDKLVDMEEDDLVTFSGKFLKSSKSCLEGANITKSFYGSDPNFIVKFSDVTKQK